MKNVTPSDFQMPQLHLAWLGRGLVIIIIIWALFSCFATVPADSEGVLTRFGKFQEVVKPGLRFKLPLGIDQMVIVAVQRQKKMEFGFGTRNATDVFQQSSEPEEEQTMVTGDLNMALVEWVVQYRIDDPKKFLFNVEG